MICIRCNRRLTKSASPAFLVGPVCLKRMEPDVKHSASTVPKIVRDDRTPDLFPLTPEFIAQLEMMP